MKILRPDTRPSKESARGQGLTQLFRIEVHKQFWFGCKTTGKIWFINLHKYYSSSCLLHSSQFFINIVKVLGLSIIIIVTTHLTLLHQSEICIHCCVPSERKCTFVFYKKSSEKNIVNRENISVNASYIPNLLTPKSNTLFLAL